MKHRVTYLREFSLLHNFNSAITFASILNCDRLSYDFMVVDGSCFDGFISDDEESRITKGRGIVIRC